MSVATHLNLRPSDPAHSRKLILQQEMVSFVIKAPLADCQISTIGFDLKQKYKVHKLN